MVAKGTKLMGIEKTVDGTSPSRIIQSATKDASEADVDLVYEITKSYISQPHTICLAVVSATTDYANQPILNMVRKFDPNHGLGI
ncbi:hypothetical protein VTN77DRAFT_8517 [Rasamsonia byssochlamydoides]|uniref:uncharacterized protein n=1 Tax=Rasamsonia byssochlamydoides TaxID=89139 RepID=UPI0037433A26